MEQERQQEERQEEQQGQEEQQRQEEEQRGGHWRCTAAPWGEMAGTGGMLTEERGNSGDVWPPRGAKWPQLGGC